jgi:8-oxo-dGTP diphosphatase
MSKMSDPRHIVAAAGYIVNAAGQVLLVHTLHRADTWEMPGGQVEEGESVEDAVKREILEESGIVCEVAGVSGIYQNRQSNVIVVVFRGIMTGGTLSTSEETSAVRFVGPTPKILREMITRPQFLERTLQAQSGPTVPFSAVWPCPTRMRPTFPS